MRREGRPLFRGAGAEVFGFRFRASASSKSALNSGERAVCHMTTASLTGMADGMERRGLIRRTKQSDRRKTILELTDAGRKLVEEVFSAQPPC